MDSHIIEELNQNIMGLVYELRRYNDLRGAEQKDRVVSICEAARARPYPGKSARAGSIKSHVEALRESSYPNYNNPPGGGGSAKEFQIEKKPY